MIWFALVSFENLLSKYWFIFIENLNWYSLRKLCDKCIKFLTLQEYIKLQLLLENSVKISSKSISYLKNSEQKTVIDRTMYGSVDMVWWRKVHLSPEPFSRFHRVLNWLVSPVYFFSSAYNCLYCRKATTHIHEIIPFSLAFRICCSF